jgi:hypothetical protein
MPQYKFNIFIFSFSNASKILIKKGFVFQFKFCANHPQPAYNSGFASVFAVKHCAKIEHSDKAKNRTQSRKTLAVIATTTFQNEICGGIKSVTLPQDGQTCLYPFPCGI